MSNLNEKGWVNATIKSKKNVEEGKNTHYLEVYEAKTNYDKKYDDNNKEKIENNYKKNNDDLPF